MAALTAFDVGAILTPFATHHVDLVVVGGTAAWVHGASRRPRDVDVVLRAGWDNAERAAAALRQLHARIPDYSHYLAADQRARLPPVVLDAATVAGRLTVWHTDFGGLDLLDSILDRRHQPRYYEHLIDTATRHPLAGITLPVAALADIIESKLAAARPKDLAVVAELTANGDRSPTPVAQRSLSVVP